MYNPVEVMEPAAGLIVHVTAVFAVPVTDAVNCWVCDSCSAAVPGVTKTATGGISVMVAVSDFAGSATLVAVTVTVWEEVIDAGAV